MKVMLPVTMTDAMLVSSTEAETDHPAYNAGTTYADGANVIKDHRRYESLQNGNTGNDPATATAWWLDIGPTNRWAMFDERVNTVTTAAASTLTVRIEPGTIINAVALVECACESARVRFYDESANLVYDETRNLDQTSIGDWLEYLTNEYYWISEALFTDIPPIAGGELKVDLTSAATSPKPSIGNLAFGRVYDIGQTQSGAKVGITDYSRKSTDAFGVTSLVQRDYARRMTASVLIDNVYLRKIYKLLASLRATPCVWIGTDDLDRYTPLLVYGYYKDWSVGVEYPTYSIYSLEVEGMI